MKHYIYLTLCLISNGLFAQFQGPVNAITNGYGSIGPNSVAVTNIVNDHYFLKKISIFYPQGTSTPVPTLFFSHGFGGIDTTNYIETMRNLASNGYAVVYVPYKSIVTNTQRYLTLIDGFKKAARSLTSIIDTTNVGFFGHSFGAGAIPRTSYRLFTENNWGTNGKFIYCSAPWYSLELGASNLSNFPTDCNMLMVLLDNDVTNDHRMGMDIFNNIAIDDSIKDCIILYSDTVSGYIYDSDHSVPAQYTPSGEFNAYDYYLDFRLLGALADYTFTGNLIAKDIALGNGSASQIDMGPQLKPLTVTDSPAPIYPESRYTNPCSDITNERLSYCQFTVSLTENNSITTLNIFPNPASSIIYIQLPEQTQDVYISLFNVYGEQIMGFKNQYEIDLINFPNGIYFMKIHIGEEIITRKFVKN